VTRRDRRELPQFVERIAKGLSSVAPACELHRAQFGAHPTENFGAGSGGW